MARAALPVTDIVRAGVVLADETVGDPIENHSVANDGHVFILAHNTNAVATAHTLTVHVAETVDGLAVTSRTYTIDTEETQLIGPFDVKTYGNPIDVDVDDAELQLAAYRI
jgi:hypothetical protein